MAWHGLSMGCGLSKTIKINKKNNWFHQKPHACDAVSGGDLWDACGFSRKKKFSWFKHWHHWHLKIF